MSPAPRPFSWRAEPVGASRTGCVRFVGRWFEPLRRDSPASSTTVPPPVRALAAIGRRQARDDAGRAPATLHMPTSAGWLWLRASRPDVATPGCVTIVIERTFGEQAAPLRLAAYGLTDREREIATLVARGVSTQALAKRLVLAPWTVQDHLEAIFTGSARAAAASSAHADLLRGVPARVRDARAASRRRVVRQGHG